MSFLRNVNTWDSWVLCLMSADSVERGFCEFNPSQENVGFVSLWVCMMSTGDEELGEEPTNNIYY